MKNTLFNKDIPVLEFDFDEFYINIINNKFLPYPVKDFVKTTGEKGFNESLMDISVVRDYLANRTLNLSRDNAKTILNVAALPQSLKTEERLKIVMACRGLVMQDNFWIKTPNDECDFENVCLRHNRLSDASYDIAILGKYISATAEDLRSDLSTGGMFPKFWHRGPNGVELWKTDRLKGNGNSIPEIKASQILYEAQANVILYRKEQKADITFSVCDCIADDDISLICAQDIIDWCNHTNTPFNRIIEKYKTDFANMVVGDYVIANTDRHFENWGFLVNTDNEIIKMAPLYDLNQALVADVFQTNINDLIYEPTGKDFLTSVKEYAPYCNLDFDLVKNLSEECIKRWNTVTLYIEKEIYVTPLEKIIKNTSNHDSVEKIIQKDHKLER